MNNNCFTLQGGKYHITENGKDAYRVREGSLLVFVVPVRDGAVGRRSFIYEASEGEIIPGFSYRDEEYSQWRFCLVALESAQVEVIENGSTKPLKDKFAAKAQLKNYKFEGFEESLVDKYRTNTVKDDSFIRRSRTQRKDDSENLLKLIYSAFSKKAVSYEAQITDNPLYNAMAVLCERMSVPIAPYEKVKETYGDGPSVADIAGLSHFPYREILLTEGWQNEDAGSFIVFDEGGYPYVCLQKGTNRYVLYDPYQEAVMPVTRRVARSLSAKAYMIYKPLPARKITRKDIVSFCLSCVRLPDVLLLAVMTLFTAFIGLLTPSISQMIYDTYIPLGAKTVLLQMGCMLASFMLANIMFTIVKNIVNFRITGKMGYGMQAAVYDRLLNLPESFFRDHESADLAQRVMSTGSIVNTVAANIIAGVVVLVYIIIYLAKMLTYSAKLTLAGLLMVAVYGVAYYCVSLIAAKYRKKSAETDGKASSTMFQLLNGISKIRIAGVEDRALYEYMKSYVSVRDSEAKEGLVRGVGGVLGLAADSLFSLVLYTMIINNSMSISLGEFLAFSSIFGAFSAYMMQAVSGAVSISEIKPDIDRLKPVLEEIPELDEAKELPGDLTGEIEISNVTFAYSDDSPNVLDGVSLSIRGGEYVAIVGPSGCGKSTLLKLLLGFEKPTAGRIYYDNKDIDSVDKRELRKRMGVVLQDGKLISGSIFENITITAPGATLEDVQQVVAAVGLEEDIKGMPMGLHTIVSEDGGTISGGQMQRILIARAIISHPAVVFFDEATSALDNHTQSMVCQALEALDSTRVVIAHRLSTIINCDRIIVMDNGHVIEQGSFPELMEKKGLFYQLASRQLT